jgi:hypothetical protein
VQFYGLDFGGGKLSRMGNLAHVSGVASAAKMSGCGG